MSARLAIGAVGALAGLAALGSRNGSRSREPSWFSSTQEATKAAEGARLKITSSLAFRRWSSGSRVRRLDGRMLVVYHGSGSRFDFFDPDRAPYRGGLLAFFSSSPAFAAEYGPEVFPAYLSIGRPFDFREPGAIQEVRDFYEFTGGVQDSHEARRILMGLEGAGVITSGPEDTMDTRWSAEDLTSDLFAEAVHAGSWDAIESDEFVEHLFNQGYDGVVLLEGTAINYGVFDNDQILSAVRGDLP
jgi:hypothetical protein